MSLDTILVAIGPSDADRIDRLAEETIDVAGPAGSTVVLGHVFTKDEYEDALDKLEFDTTAEEVSPNDVAARHSTIRELTKLFDAAGVDYEVRGVVGDHGKAIVDLAEEVDADRVLVGGRKRSPTGKAVFGSVAQEVMLSAPCPVTFVRADTK
ncbi:Nucleotide-binding universal stress protein, UspA family [Halogranum gelatinilyticum]|uniref:Nucleotide-binding universal stress protein, UspA family n=1 Tax=Halogranum gelatinilyticum TaxID=660521 RepID=A0A1G9PWR7_9EURY|nr:universal stress protein [Halogranum gelatinilyticum]SDM03113.1 Nucleotide-binding universal stress protein, UspA family [Halogranum gelatinilyticum]